MIRNVLILSTVLSIISLIALIYVYYVPLSGSASSGTVTYYSAETKFMWAATNLAVINVLLLSFMGYGAFHDWDFRKINE
jgi:hypothetical protein